MSLILIPKSSRGRNSKLIAALDIGASKISCIIARRGEEHDGTPFAEIVGVGHHGSESSVGARMPLREIEKCLTRAVDAAERMAGERIHNVIVGVPGPLLRTRRVGVDIETSGGLVTQDDVDDCLGEGAAIAAADDCHSLHIGPIRSYVDGEDAFNDPVGLSGHQLSMHMLGVAARHSALDNLSSLIERCSLRVDEYVASPVAAADAVLLEDERDLGVVLIDVGVAMTNYAVFDSGVLMDCGGVRVGGGHITRDIAQIFGAPLSEAERIKNLNGAALIGPGDEHREIEFPQLGVAGESSRASRADLCEVIIPRMQEIFEMVLHKLPKDDLQRIGLRRAVITGGGSSLVGAREAAERALGMKTRIGKPISIPGAPEAATAPGFSVCVGLIQNAIKSDINRKSTLGVTDQSPQMLTRSAFLSGVETWLRARF